MNIEEDIFKRSKIKRSKLLEYGFKENKDNLIYEVNIINNTFKVEITVSNDNSITGKIYDNSINEEYTNFRIKNIPGEFASNIRNVYENILNDIKSSCTEPSNFINNQTNRISKYIKEKYNIDPEFLWDKTPGCGVFRNTNNKKWFGIIMDINKNKLDNEDKIVEILNVKLDPIKIENLLKENGFYKAYHMNKKYWITIILDETIKDEIIQKLIDESFSFTEK